MKIFLRNNFILLIATTLSYISFGQTAKDVTSNSVDNPVILNQITTVTSDSARIRSASTTNWHSENSRDGVVSISKRRNEPQVVHNKAYFENEIVRIDNHILAINAKIETLNNDPELKSKALDAGWFDDMEQIKNELEVQKTQIQNILINSEN